MNTTRTELVRMFVLDAVADSCESMERVREHVCNLSQRCGLEFQFSEMIQGLREVISASLVGAFQFHDGSADAIEGIPKDLESDEDLLFCITDKGRTLQLSEYDPWPFDEHNILKKHWVPPRS